MTFYNQKHHSDKIISGGETDLIKYFSSLWRGKWFIILCILFCTVVSDLYVRHFEVQFYPATTKIALQEGHPRKILTDIESVMSHGPITTTGINTELEIIRSRELVGQLVDSLDLTNNAAFNRLLQEPPVYNQFITQFLAIFGLDFQNPLSATSSEDVRSNVISSVLKAMTITNTRNTLVIDISVTTVDAALSVLMANTMAKLYIESQIQVKLDILANATEFLSARTSELKQEYEDLNAKLTNFSSQSELVNPAILKAQEIQLRDLRIRLTEAKELVLEETDKSIIFRSLRDSGNLQDLITTANDFRLNRAISHYHNNKISLEQLYLQVDRFMLDIKAQAERGQKQLSALETSEALLFNQIEQQSAELIVLQQLERETEAARLLYESFFTRLLEMNVQLGLETADGRILSKAIQSGPSSPMKNKTLLLACLIGFMMGACLLILREMSFSGYRSINDLRDNSGYKVLASVPVIPIRERKTAVSYFQNKPNSLVSEAVRNLRTSILMSYSDRVPQVIMLTSSVSKEGKTILTYALAQNMIGLGKRVLLIEADIRRRVQSVDIDRKNTISLTDLLMNEKNLKDLNLFVEELGFNILTAKKSNKNAADIFSSKKFSEVLTELREHYDYILIDSPPVLAVPDARVIGKNCDANIYIVEWNKTTRSQVDQGLDMLSSAGVNITGLVLNQVDPHKIKSYGYVNQYGYGSYGSEYYES